MKELTKVKDLMMIAERHIRINITPDFIPVHIELEEWSGVLSYTYRTAACLNTIILHFQDSHHIVIETEKGLTLAVWRKEKKTYQVQFSRHDANRLTEMEARAKSDLQEAM